MEQKFIEELKTLKIRIDKEIKSFFSETRTTKKGLLKEFVLNGGKRLRPIIMLKAYEGYGGKKDILQESISIELLHNSTLIHDDVMDEDEIRRGKPTVYKTIKDTITEKKYKGSLFNKKSSRIAVSDAIILGNILYSLGGTCLKGKSLEIYNQSYIKVNEGQYYDLLFESEMPLEEEYLKMIELKSCAIVKAAAEIGAKYANASEENIVELKKYINDMIIGFQIHDDLMDINPEMNKGHKIGSDIRQGKRTLLVIKALELGSVKNRKIIEKSLGTKRVNKAIKALYYTGAVQYCTDLAEKKIKSSKKHLSKAGLNKETEEFFSNLADFVINREN